LNQKIDSSLELDLVANWGPKGHLKGKISHVDHWFILSGESRSFEQIVRDIADRVWKFSCHDISSTSSKGPHLDGHYLKGFFYLVIPLHQGILIAAEDSVQLTPQYDK
jgi:hypothetical protein